jgi:hypothetical protein
MLAYLTYGTASLAVLAALGFTVFMSVHLIGPTQVGLVNKRWSRRKLLGNSPVAFSGEAGYQAALLKPGLRFKLWPLFAVTKHPWVQVPAGEIGLVIAQVGQPLLNGAKTARDFGGPSLFCDLDAFLAAGGQKGVQRPVLPPGTIAPIHPVAFIVYTASGYYGEPVDEALQLASLGLAEQQLKSVVIEPQAEEVEPDAGEPHEARRRRVRDVVGIVTAYEGPPLDGGDIAGRLGGFADVAQREHEGAADAELVEVLLGSQNQRHNNYQDPEAFFVAGGRIGLQHDPILYGTYNINPFIFRIEIVPMLVVEQGQVAVVKSYVGLPTKDTSGAEFKFGSLVRPGRRGIWQEPMRTGKYAMNPRCYAAVIVPTSILTLNWAQAVSQAHKLDAKLSQIDAKSREGFEFRIDLQVQIHVPDTLAPRVISVVGSMQNLVNEVLQAAVGNHFRDKLQSMPAIEFIEKRQDVQEQAFEHIKAKLAEYQVETRGVYIQDVVLPGDIVKVLTEREIAAQQRQTLDMQKEAEQKRVAMEAAKGRADMQADLAKSEVGIQIATNQATARKAQADGEATYTRLTGEAAGAEIEAVGLARAKSYEAQQKALGSTATAVINVMERMEKVQHRFVPEILVTGGNGLDGLAATLMGKLAGITVDAATDQPVAGARPNGHAQ